MSNVKAPEISVIVPVYNVEIYLDRCIESIIKSTFSDFELILIDDGSPDSSPEICDEWEKKDSRIKVIHQKNSGVSCARNKGLSVAKGEYILFVDSDDYIFPGMLSLLFELSKLYDADISMCNFIRGVNFYKDVHNQCDNINVYTKEDFLDIMLRIKGNRCVHYPFAKLYKKKLFDIVEHFPLGIVNGEDVVATYKAVMKSEIIVETNRIGYFYQLNKTSVTNSLFGKHHLALENVWRMILELTVKDYPQFYNKVNYNYKRTSFTILCHMIIDGNEESDITFKEEQKNLLIKLRKNFFFLLRSPMDYKRKIVMCFLLCNYSITKCILRNLKNLLK